MISIAVDGPSGAGKSTLAKSIAKALDIHYLDTGAMYRAAAYAAINEGVDIGDEKQVARFADALDMQVEYISGEQKVIVSGNDVTPFIRTPEISKAASAVSAYPCIRKKLASMQRDTAAEYDIVLDGRDIGTYVLPDAPYKFFITADAGERAKRRLLELESKGLKASYGDVLRDMQQRDQNDSSRSFAPLKKAEDAVLIDTTDMTEGEVLDAVLSVVRQERSDDL